jgi:hypothetical protein
MGDGRVFGSLLFLWTVGLLEGSGEIPVLVQDDGDACGRRHLLEGVVQALPHASS